MLLEWIPIYSLPDCQEEARSRKKVSSLSILMEGKEENLSFLSVRNFFDWNCDSLVRAIHSLLRARCAITVHETFKD